MIISPNFDLTAAIRAEKERRKRILAMKGDAEDDLLAFVRMMWHAVEPTTTLSIAWPLEAIADVLMAVSDGEILRLIINVFPGAMKSLMLNVFWPAWEWGPRGMPSTRYISTSYSAGVTERDNDRMMRIVTDPIYRAAWPNVELRKEGVKMVENTKTGWKMATSVGGRMTGFRGDRILIDDPNDPNNVDSEDIRNGTNLWLREVMPDRLNNLAEGAIVLIQQRAHEQDATATLAEYGVGYHWMMIPMEYDPLRASPVVLRTDEGGGPIDVWQDPRGLDDNGYLLEGLFTNAKGNLEVRPGSPMAQAEGELAWPDRFPLDAVQAMQHEKGAHAYAGQYQQMPGVRGGAIINRDWWQLWESKNFPDFGTVIASLDTALEEKKENDSNALTGWGAFPSENGAPQLMLRYAGKLKAPLAMLVKWIADACYEIRADYLLIEHKTRGRDVYDEIKRLYADAPWETVLILPKTDKVARLNAVSHLFSGDVRTDPLSGMKVYENGMIWAPSTLWADEVISEVAAFPHGVHDDYVDTTSQALSWMRKNGVVLRKVEHDANEEDLKKYRRKPAVPYVIGR